MNRRSPRFFISIIAVCTLLAIGVGVWFYQSNNSQKPQITGSISIPTPTPTPCPTSQPTSTSTIKPGGLWITPDNNFSVTRGQTLTLSTHAYPTNSGDPAIAYVQLTAYWAGLNLCQWPTLARVYPTPGTDVFSYTWDLTYQGNPIPSGAIQISFDVYDVAGNVNLAPNGVHSGQLY